MKAVFAEANINVDLERFVLCQDQCSFNTVIEPKDVLTDAVNIKVLSFGHDDLLFYSKHKN